MSNLSDYIPVEVRKLVLAGFAALALFACWSHVRCALKAGAIQRLSDTPKHTRSDSQGMFWFLVTFFAVGAVLFAVLLAAVIWHWRDDRVL
jgi:hypothetical protein